VRIPLFSIVCRENFDILCTNLGIHNATFLDVSDRIHWIDMIFIGLKQRWVLLQAMGKDSYSFSYPAKRERKSSRSIKSCRITKSQLTVNFAGQSQKGVGDLTHSLNIISHNNRPVLVIDHA
jgi:hypothetical protein